MLLPAPALLLVACDPSSTDRAPADPSPPSPVLPPELAAPAPGEWPMFKRSLDHRGAAEDLAGDFLHEACVWWDVPVTGDGTRGCGGAVVGAVDGEPTVFVAVDGWCSDDGASCTSGFDPEAYVPIPGVPGKVWALRGASGDVRWSWLADDGAQFDPYGPLLADLDGDGPRELVVPSTNSRWVYAFDAGAGGAGWRWRADLGEDRTSEGAPAAVDLDGDGRLEVVLGDDASETADGGRARVHVFDADGVERSTAEVPNRSDVPGAPGCTGGRKIDSSQPAVVELEGVPVVLAGAWDGALWAFHWDDGLTERWSSELPERPDEVCRVAKVRSSPVVADLDGDDREEVVFGWMYEDTDGGTEYEDAALRTVDLQTGDLIADESAGAWKSSPSVGDLDPGGALELAAGWTGGVLAVDADLAEVWREGVPASRYEVGNRSSPALADLDNDGDLDVVIGLEGPFGPTDPALVALDGETGATLWSVAYGHDSTGTCSSPAVADLDGDGTLEVVVLGRDGVLRAIGRCP